MLGMADDDGGLVDATYGDDHGAGAVDAAGLPAAAPSLPQRQPPTFVEVSARAQRDIGALHAKLLGIHRGIVAQAPLQAKDVVAFYSDVHSAESNKQQMKGACLACGKVMSSTASCRFI